MNKHINWLTAILISIAFISCGKDKDEEPAKTKTELITQSGWKFDKATAGVYGDVSAYINACYKDNTFVFVANGTGTVDEATVVCSPSTAGAFTWSFQNNESLLNVSASLLPTGSNTFNLISLNETNMVLTQNVTLPPPVSTTVLVEFTLKH